MTLQLQDIHVTVADGPDRLTILDGTTLAVGPGELIAVTGVSGSGKSTLVAVSGLLRRPDQGQVLIDGEDLSDAPDRRRATVRRDHIGLIFQSANLFPSLTSIQQLELVAHLDGKITTDDRDQARHLLDNVGLSSPEANGNASRSPECSWAIPRSCSPTNPPQHSTMPAGGRSWLSSPSSPPPDKPRPSWSPTLPTSSTTQTMPCAWPKERSTQPQTGTPRRSNGTASDCAYGKARSTAAQPRIRTSHPPVDVNLRCLSTWGRDGSTDRSTGSRRAAMSSPSP